MNSTDKIREFFQQRLRDTTPTEADWNVPSDEIWNKAKVHFPKKKNKRRPFLFLLFGLGLLLGISATLYFSKEEKQNVNTEKINASTDSQTDKLGHQKAATKALIEENDLTNNTKLEASTIPSEVELLNRQALDIDSNLASIPMQKERDVVSRKKRQTVLKTIVASEGTLDEKEGKMEHIVDQGLKASGKIEGTQFTILEGIEVTASNEHIKNEERGLMNLIHLPVLKTKVEREKKEELAGIEALMIKPLRKINRWELGLSYAPFTLLSNGAFETEGNPSEQITVGINQLNFNVPISRRLSSRLSLSSGMYFSKLDLDLKVSAEEIYKKDLTKSKLRSVLNDNTSNGSFTINDVSRDVEIEFKKDANLQNGDTLVLKAGLPIKLQVIQFPLMLNYHFGKKKIEGLLHAGITFDYLKAGIETLDFEVFKDGNSITEPLDFDPLNEAAFFGTIYLGAGMKYHINDQFNLGLSAKIDAAALVFSRFEFGVYYGF